MIDRAHFRALAGAFPSGVTVVMAQTDRGPVGATVSAFAAVSLDPPLVTVILAKTSRTAAVLAGLGPLRTFSVNVLREDQRPLALQFAANGLNDKFEGVETRECDVIGGCPVLCDAVATLVCRPYTQYVVGDHVIFVGEVVGGVARDGRPLVHCRGQFGL